MDSGLDSLGNFFFITTIIPYRKLHSESKLQDLIGVTRLALQLKFLETCSKNSAWSDFLQSFHNHITQVLKFPQHVILELYKFADSRVFFQVLQN